MSGKTKAAKLFDAITTSDALQFLRTKLNAGTELKITAQSLVAAMKLADTDAKKVAVFDEIARQLNEAVERYDAA